MEHARALEAALPEGAAAGMPARTFSGRAAAHRSKCDVGRYATGFGDFYAFLTNADFRLIAPKPYNNPICCASPKRVNRITSAELRLAAQIEARLMTT